MLLELIIIAIILFLAITALQKLKDFTSGGIFSIFNPVGDLVGAVPGGVF